MPRSLHRSAALRILRALVAIGALLLVGCAADADVDGAAEDGGTTSLGYVGTVEGTDAFVSVLIGDSDTEPDEAIVYVCDGDAELREWFRGPVDDPTGFELTNDAGATVRVDLVGGTASGQFTDPAGSVHGFEAIEATGQAGLYEVDDPDATAEGVWAAWVVDNDGNERGAFLRAGTFESTPRLSSTSFKLSRFSVTTGIVGMNGIISPNN